MDGKINSKPQSLYGFPSNVPIQLKQAYAQRGIKKLFQWQSECLSDSTLFAPEYSNLIYSAPTSAGKTLIAEVLAACNCLETGRRTIFVLPYISVAREKLLYLQSLWRSIGLVVKPFIGASSTSVNGWSAAVCTIEKANALLNALIEVDSAHEIGTVVVDELHILFESERGAVVENLIAKLLFISKQNNSSNRIQIIGLSATLGDNELHKMLANWIDARTFQTEFRPLELHEYLVHETGHIFNLLENGEKCRELDENFIIKGDNKCIIGITLEALLQSQSILIFCPTKAEAEQSAILLAKYLKYCLDKGEANRFPTLSSILPREKISEAIEYFRQKNACSERDLLQCIGQGVAFHHAGLTIEEREVIEALFRSGHLRVLVSTSTLSSGVNLPAHRVLIRTSAGGPVPFSFVTYSQMVGRAGRQGQTISAGESYLLCNANDWLAVQRQIQRRTFNRPKRTFGRLLLETINSSLCKNLGDVNNLIENCLFSQQARSLDEELTYLIQLKVITLGGDSLPEFDEEKSDSDNINVQNQAGIGADNSFDKQTTTKYTLVRPTQLGRAVLASSLDLRTALQVFDGLKKAMQSICLDTELHMLYLVTPVNNLAINENSINWNFFHKQWTKLSEERRRVAQRIGISEEFFMQKLGGRSFPREHPLLNLHVRFLASLILYELINEKALQDVAKIWGINRGLLQSLQQQAATYAYMIVSFCDRLGWVHLKTLLDDFAERLQFGIRRDLTELVRIQGIDAIRARAFHRMGIESLVSLANCPLIRVCTVLRKAVPFKINSDTEVNLEDGEEEKNTWLHDEPPTYERVAAKTLIERAKIAIKEKIKAFKIVNFPTCISKSDVNLSLRFDTSVLSVLNNDDGEDKLEESTAVADLSKSILEEAWLSEDESNNNSSNALLGGVSLLATTDDESAVDSLCDTFSPLRLEKPTIFNERQNTNNYIKEKKIPPIFNIEDYDNFKENIPPEFLENAKRKTLEKENNKDLTRTAMKNSWESKASASSINSKEVPNATTMPSSPFQSPRAKKFATTKEINCELKNINLNNKNCNKIKTKIEKTKMAVINPICSCTTIKQILAIFTECWLLISDDIVLLAYDDDFDQTLVFHSFPLSTLPENFCKICKNSSTLLFSILEHLRIRKWVFCGLEFVRKLRVFLPECNENNQQKLIESKNLWCLQTLDALTNGNGPSELLQSNSNIKLLTSTKLLNILERFTSSNKFALKMYKKLSNSNQKISPTLLLQTIQFLSRTILNEIKNTKENKYLIFDNNLLSLYMQSMVITAKMESVGIELGRRKAGKMVSYILEKMVFIEGEIYKLAGERFNLDSASEVSKILFIKLQLNLPEHIITNNNCKTRKRHRRHFPTNASVLKQINHPICVKIEKWRRMSNALSCLRSLLASVSSGDSRIHSHFENIGTITGRVCCFSPNLQFISKKSLFDEKTAISVRSIFVVPNGRILLAVDYSQLELRILCALSEDLELTKMLKEEDPFERISIEFGRSINSKNNEKENKEIVGIGREKAKQLCYAIIYGMGATTLGNELKNSNRRSTIIN
uniref:DNA-directed DNA polymerase n=1 Tax=Meloidogyne incognita TaxID=6306 RepID=A0A914KR24_MELIC